jgi:hypothetical protein
MIPSPSTLLSPLTALLLIAHGTAFSSPTLSPQAYTVPHSNAAITRLLIGHWQGEQKGFRGILIYRADGTCSSTVKPHSLLMRLIATPYHFSGTWRIQKGKLHTRVTQSSTRAIAVGTHYINEILHLDHHTFITKNEKGWITTFTRQPESSATL